MTPEIIQQRALFLYLVEGASFNSIAEQIRKEYGTRTTAKSVQSWAKKKDKAGMTWEDRRVAVTEKSNHRVEVIAENRQTEVLQRVQAVHDVLYQKIISESAPDIKTFESAVYALKEIAKFEGELQKSKDQNTPMAIVQAMLEVFASCPPVAKAIQANWPQLSRQIQNKIMGESG